MQWIIPPLSPILQKAFFQSTFCLFISYLKGICGYWIKQFLWLCGYGFMDSVQVQQMLSKSDAAVCFPLPKVPVHMAQDGLSMFLSGFHSWPVHGQCKSILKKSWKGPQYFVSVWHASRGWTGREICPQSKAGGRGNCWDISAGIWDTKRVDDGFWQMEEI